MESHKGLLYPGLLKMNEGRVNKIWKLFMVFAMRGGEVLRVINVFSKMVLCKNHLESFPGCRVWALYYIQIAVAVTMSMAEYTSSCQF